MNFDEPIERRGTHSAKWDLMEKLYGVPAEDGISMWVADMDFHPPQCIQKAIDNFAAHGVYGYFGGDGPYRDAICWWMENRHGWTVDPSHIFTTHGLVNGTSICVDTFTDPGDSVVLFTPVYHAFAKVIRAAGRQVVECPLVTEHGQYKMDFANWDAQMTGNEKMVILCSPHNPGGRVWTRDELQGVADFAKRHDLVLVSDEIHHDLVFGGQKHIPMTNVDPSISDRLVMMTATSKTFNIAGLHTGNVIIADEKLRKMFAQRMLGLGISANSLGILAATAAYSPDGAEWVDQLVEYLAENKRIFDEAINSIPGLTAMDLQATYLAWVDFSSTGMDMSEVHERIQKTARIAANYGETFGKGGENYLRFNLGTTRASVIEATDRLKAAFSDLQ